MCSRTSILHLKCSSLDMFGWSFRGAPVSGEGGKLVVINGCLDQKKSAIGTKSSNHILVSPRRGEA
jgi:hypothetical protein